MKIFNAQFSMNFQLANFQKTFLAVGGFLVAFLAVGIFVLVYGAFALYSPVNTFGGAVFEIPENASVNFVIENWNISGIPAIKHSYIFKVYAHLTGVDKKIKAGMFTLPQYPISHIEFARFLTEKAKSKEVKFTIPEGYTLQQIAELLADKNLAVYEDFITQAEREFPIFNFQFSTKEGYLFPDTYRVYEGASADEIIQKMRDNFKRKVEPLLPEIENHGKTLEQVIIMASILEREVKTEEDMRKVADILWRRFESGVKLEVDSTLNYILPKEERREALTFIQLASDSPYNTYKYSGLPPAPIGNPGLKAIKAAINPGPNEYWYFLSTPDSTIVYAKTFDEQRRNKKEYLN